MVDSGGGGNSDTKSCTAGGGGGGGGYGGGGGGLHGNDDQDSCGGGGGGSYAVMSTKQGGPQTRPSNPLGSFGSVVLQFLIETEASPIGVSQQLNDDTFQSGDTMTVGVSVQNSQQPTDFFMGTLLPDGNTMFFVTDLQPLTLQQGFLDDPHTFQPLSDRGVIPNSVNAALPGLLSYVITGIEPSGNYQFFSALTQPNAFGNGSIDPGDFIALDIDPFSLEDTEAQ